MADALDRIASRTAPPEVKTEKVKSASKLAWRAEAVVKIESVLRDNPGASEREIAKLTGISQATVHRLTKAFKGEATKGHRTAIDDSLDVDSGWEDRGRNYA